MMMIAKPIYVIPTMTMIVILADAVFNIFVSESDFITKRTMIC